MSELNGQMSLDMNDLLGAAAPQDDGWGYDEEGHLLADVMDAAGEGMVDPAAIERADTLAAEINAIREQTRGVVISAALAIGARLIEAKNLVPRGRWIPWLKEHVDYSDRKAQDLMRLYEAYGKQTIPRAIAEMDYTKAVALLSLPEEQREAVAEKAAAEDLSSRALQDEIARLRAENASRQTKIDDLLAQAEEKAREYTDYQGTAARAIDQEHEAAERARGEAAAAADTAEALRLELAAVKSGREAEAERAGEAIRRANDVTQENRELKERIQALEDARPEPERVEVIPEDVQRELERLRAQAAAQAAQSGEAVIRLRDAYKRLTEEFRGLAELLEAVKAEAPDEAVKYAAALQKAAAMMAEKFGGMA